MSIYNVKEFKIALRDNKVKIIQIPGNFFNQKLLNEKLLQKAQKRDTDRGEISIYAGTII